MKRLVGRPILILALVMPLGASLVVGGSAAADQPAGGTPPVCEVLGVSSHHGGFFTDWSFVARVSSADETGGVGVWKMLGHRFVLKLRKGQPNTLGTFHARTESSTPKVAPKLLACH